MLRVYKGGVEREGATEKRARITMTAMDTVVGLLSLRQPAKESRRQAEPLDSLREALLAPPSSACATVTDRR